jgi:hypothetical protein
MKRNLVNLITIAFVALATSIGGAQSFSADVAYVNSTTGQPGSPPLSPQMTESRLFVSGGKLRLETRGLVDLVLLVDPASRTTLALYPAQKVYRQLGSRPSQYFRVTDPQHACPDWQQAAGRPLNCEKVGNEDVGGREAVKYKSSNPDGSVDYIWIDSKLDYVVKWDMSGAAAELRNVKEGPQSADLFVIPQGYDVLKPQRKQGSLRAHGK